MFQIIFQITWNLLRFLIYQLHNLTHQLIIHVSLDHHLLHVKHHLVTLSLLIEMTHHVCRRLGHKTLFPFQQRPMQSMVLMQGEYLQRKM
jgi:hypothetical protein